MSDNLSTSVNIFSYGTLQDPQVQAQVLNRQVESWPDSLSYYELGFITITDPSVSVCLDSGITCYAYVANTQ